MLDADVEGAILLLQQGQLHVICRYFWSEGDLSSKVDALLLRQGIEKRARRKGSNDSLGLGGLLCHWTAHGEGITIGIQQ